MNLRKNIVTTEKLIAAFIVFIAGMIVARIIYSKSLMYIFLLWNILLAYIPFKASNVLLKRKDNSLQSIILFIVWLLFFPNTLYIITDLIHLEVKTDVPIWYDVILLFTSASAGLIMAFASIYKIESFLKDRIKPAFINLIIVGCLFLGSFGVYLGRFLRWNSWNVLNRPFALSISIAKLVIFPREYTHAWAFTFIFSGLVFLMFYTFKYFIANSSLGI